MEVYNAMVIAKTEIIRILLAKNDSTYQFIYDNFDMITYPHIIKSTLKDAVWELYHSNIVNIVDEEITNHSIIHLNKIIK